MKKGRLTLLKIKKNISLDGRVWNEVFVIIYVVYEDSSIDIVIYCDEFVE